MITKQKIVNILEEHISSPDVDTVDLDRASVKIMEIILEEHLNKAHASWQLCPKCNGLKTIKIFNMNMSTNAFNITTCDVCFGTGTIKTH